jgi:hypothetical protein
MGPTKTAKSKEHTAKRIKIIDGIIAAYKAKKLSIQAQQAKWDSVNTEAVFYEDVKKRMSKAYQRNKRQKKIDKLQQIKSHWKNLS